MPIPFLYISNKAKQKQKYNHASVNSFNSILIAAPHSMPYPLPSTQDTSLLHLFSPSTPIHTHIFTCTQTISQLEKPSMTESGTDSQRWYKKVFKATPSIYLQYCYYNTINLSKNEQKFKITIQTNKQINNETTTTTDQACWTKNQKPAYPDIPPFFFFFSFF